MLKKVKGFLFRNTTTRQTIAKNTFWLTVSNVGGRLLRSIVVIYAARVLGAAGWGVFSYAITLAAFLTIFIDFGINAILIKESSKTSDKSYRSEILSTSFYIKLVLLALGIFIILVIAPRFATMPQAKALLPIIAAIFIFDSLRQFGFSINQALERMEREAGLFLFTNLAIVGFGFSLLLASRTVQAFSYGYALGTAAGMIATAIVLRESLTKIFSAFRWQLVKPILAACWPFAISGLLGSLMINTDILILGWLKPASDVGIYSAANRIIQVLYILPSIIAASTLPAFSRLVAQKSDKMRTALEHVISLSFLIAIPTAIGGIILGKEIMAGVFGGSFSPGAVAFQILLLTILIDFPAVILSGALFAHSKQKSLIAYSAIGGITNVVLDLLLIPSFGITGSAIATFLAQLVSNYYLWRKVKRTVAFSVTPYLKRIAIASGVMGIIVWALNAVGISFLMIVPIAGALYLFLLYKLREPLLHEATKVLKTQEEPQPSAL